MKRYVLLLCVVLSCSAAKETPVQTFQKKLDKMSAGEVNTTYTGICTNLEKSRKALAKELAAAKTKEAKSAVYTKARNLLIKTFSDSLFVCWYGTEWDFNGTTTTPRDGEIACGYFVTTLVRDAGFKIERAKLAQCASQSMINTLCPDADVKIITGGQVQKVKEHILAKPDGIFIVGLDTHTGFIVKKGTELHFVHSNYTLASDGVMSESFDESSVIQNNGYFAIGNFLNSDGTIQKWLNGTSYAEE